MREKSDYDEAMGALRHLLGKQQDDTDFSPPSLLKDVPLINANDTVEQQVVTHHATLGRNS
jgi:hypothetical protein